MKKILKHPRLILTLTAIMVSVCRCYPTDLTRTERSNNPLVVTSSDGQDLQCKKYMEFENGRFDIGVECTFTCRELNILAGPEIKGSVSLNDEDEFAALTYDELFAMACADLLNAEDSTEAPTEAPTEEPTEAPTEAPTEEAAPPQPLLTGIASACDTGLGYINFPLEGGSADITGKDLVVTINGTPVNCAIPIEKPTILACSLPPGAVFPIQVIVTMDGVEVNNFTNDGYFCTDTQSGGTTDEREEELVAPPAVVCDPNFFTCP